ncbi:MAG: hypothetical protein HW421_2433 [Ignavibacteria bacterium]|nr:hypothetical protein [Ignavibacteria bacterium]
MKIENSKLKIDKIIIFLFLLNVVLKLSIALRPLEILDDNTIPDDAYLSLKIAKNISYDFRPVYGDNYTNGFQPMYVFLMAPVYKFFPADLYAPIRIALLLLCLFDFLALFYLCKIGRILFKSLHSIYLLMLLWALSPYVTKTTANCMETMISVFFIVLSCYYILKNRLFEAENHSGKLFFLLGIILGLTVFARLDNAIFCAIYILILAYQHIIYKRNPLTPFEKGGFLIPPFSKGVRGFLFKLSTTCQILLRKLIWILLGFILAYAPWAIYSYYYTEAIFPISGKAVRLMSFHPYEIRTLFQYIKLLINWLFISTFPYNYISIIIILAYLSLAIKLKLWSVIIKNFIQEKILLIILLFTSCLVLSYLIFIPANWFFDRYFFQLTIAFFLILSFLFDQLIVSGRLKIKRFFINFSYSIIISLSFVQLYYSNLIVNTVESKGGYMRIGLWANNYFPKGTKIGSSQTGALSYFAGNLKVVNLDGVVNEPCYISLINRKNIEYIKDSKIDYVIGWQLNIDYIKLKSENFKPDDLTFIGIVPGIKTWNYEWKIYKVNR